MWTPWGESQVVCRVADGVYEVGTASHGGIILSPKKADELFTIFPEAGKSLAWEEDCNWCVPVLAWPGLFTDQHVFFAIETAKRWHKEINTDEYRHTQAGRIATEKAEKFEESIKGKWRRGSCWTIKGGGWGVMLIQEGVVKKVVMPDYPTQAFYSSEDLAAFKPVVEEGTNVL
jgi:hypothetical protein